MKPQFSLVISLLSLFLNFHSANAVLKSFGSQDLKELLDRKDYDTILDSICPKSTNSNCNTDIDQFAKLPVDKKRQAVGVREIGSGTFGKVYSVNDRIAVKVVKANRNSSTFAYLLQEINLGLKISEVKNPYLVPVVDCCMQTNYGFLKFSQEEIFYITMPYYSAGTLGDFMADESNVSILGTADWKWSVLNALIKGMNELHSSKYIHRDLKPANILMESSYQARISDFGLAKKMFEEVTNTYAGTPLYMAPEVSKKEVYDNQADVYSMGLIFFEIMNVLNYKADYPQAAIIQTYCNASAPSRYTLERLEWDTYCSVMHPIVLKMINPDRNKRPTLAGVSQYFDDHSAEFFALEDKAQAMIKQFKKLKIAHPDSGLRKKRLGLTMQEEFPLKQMPGFI